MFSIGTFSQLAFDQFPPASLQPAIAFTTVLTHVMRMIRVVGY